MQYLDQIGQFIGGGLVSLRGYVLSLIFVALAAYGAYEAYSSAMDGQRIQSLQKQVSSMQEQVTIQYQRRPGRYSWTSPSTATLTSREIVPQSAINNTAVTNPFEGTYIVLGNNSGGVSPASTFSIIADNIPKSDWEQIIRTFGAGGGFNGGPIYGYAITATNTGGRAVSKVIPDTYVNARSNCAAPGSGMVAIQFVFNG